MKHSPFRQEKTELTKPIEPDYSQLPKTGKRTVEVQSERASGKTIRQTARAIRELGTGLNGEINSTAPHTFKQGSRLGALLGGDDFYKAQYQGNANVSGEQTNQISGQEAKQLSRDVKKGMKSGQNVKIEGTNVSTGNKIQQEKNYNPQSSAKKEYQQQLISYNKQEQGKKVQANIAASKAKEGANTERIAKAKADKQEAFYVKYPNKRPKAENAALGEPVAQQSRTPFYQRGMAGDKMLLQNKNKIMSKSPLEQEKNPSTGETLQEKADRLAKEKLAAKGENKGDSKNIRTETASVSETIKGKKVEKKATTKKEIEAWKKAPKENKEKYSSKTNTATGSASDTGKDKVIPTTPKPEIPSEETPKEEPKKKMIKMSFGGKKESSQRSTGGGFTPSSGGSGKNPCSSCN
tara:strand:+ start:599 stop:1822 length:1224 start_codon:yes stop_codon:yes gene_type:complete